MISVKVTMRSGESWVTSFMGTFEAAVRYFSTQGAVNVKWVL